MNEEMLIYLTDSCVFFYNENLLKPIYSETNFKEALEQARSQIKSSPNIRLKFLIDGSAQEFQEEKLPFLLPWDYIRYKSHKKRKLQQKKGLTYFHSLKIKEERFFRSLHFAENDPLYPWIMWFNSLENINKKAVYLSLEAEKFIKQHLSNPKKYQLLIYPLSKNQFRHLIYNGPRLLLSRTSPEQEAFKSSLHFLSRKLPDIYDNLSTLSLSENLARSLSNVQVLPDEQSLIKFMSTIKRTTIKFEKPTHRYKTYAYTLLIVLLFSGTYFLYEGASYKTKKIQYLQEIEKEKSISLQLSSSTHNPKPGLYRDGVQAFQWVKKRIKNPLDALKNLSPLFPSDALVLQSLIWQNQHSKVSLVFDIILHGKSNEILSNHLKTLINRLQNVSPQSKIRILKAPFNSGPDETYNAYSNDDEGSKVQIRVDLP